MTVVIQPGYQPISDSVTLLTEAGDSIITERTNTLKTENPDEQPLCHARIAHARNWISGAIAASDTAPDYYANAPDNTLTYEKWKPLSMPATWEVTASGGDVNYCAIAAHTCGTDLVAVAVDYWDGTVWQEVGEGFPQDNSPIFFIFGGVSAEKYRVRLIGNTAPEIGVIKFGRALEMPYHIFDGHSPTSLTQQATLRQVESETGEFLGRSKQRTYGMGAFAWERLRRSWIDVHWPDLQRAVECDAVFVAWRPGTFQDVAFGQVDGVPIPSFIGLQDFMSVEMNVKTRGYA